eukprot:gene8215-6925_t
MKSSTPRPGVTTGYHCDKPPTEDWCLTQCLHPHLDALKHAGCTTQDEVAYCNRFGPAVHGEWVTGDTLCHCDAGWSGVDCGKEVL